MDLLTIGLFAGSFLLGAIPFARVAMFGTGIDITRVGSKNPGFNNVRRVVGWPRAAIPLVGDVAKGFVALFIACRVAEPSSAMMWALGLAPLIGHCWSPFLAWNGGKGVATMAGVLLFLDWKITLVCLPIYPLGRWFGRRMVWKQEGAISSVTTMFIVSCVVFGLRGWESGVFALVMFGVVVVRHVPNFREIFSK